ncbi:MAG: methyltransferase domain-containing protein [Nitriliruptorales bacterium]|nr:methyltransferase domain-containing protein [Nitriliruptorales bacterium]
MNLLPSEDEALRAARERSHEAGVPLVFAETGAVLRFFTRMIGARHVVEIGSGAGYSGLWLLQGMGPRGSLTTIELDPRLQTLAQRSYAQGGYADRVRSMLGPALSVLPRLADGNYDLVFLDAVKSEYPGYLGHAKRLLRPGGLLIADNVLWSGRVTDRSVIDAETQGLRALLRAVADDPELPSLTMGVGDGVLVAVYEPAV